MDVSAQKLSPLSREQSLKELDDLPDSRGFVDLALSSAVSLDPGTQLLLVFHSWQCGALDLVRFYSTTEKLRLDPWAELFLSAHFLRQQGYKSESIEMVKKLSQECPHEIVQYRAFADSLDQANLDDAIRAISQALPNYQGWRHGVLTFNLGVATLNKSQFTTAREMLSRLESKDDSLHQYFAHWLRGQLESHSGNIESSLKHFNQAIELLNQLQSRRTDKAIILANAISESLWLGHEQGARDLLKELLLTNQNGTGTLPTLRVVAAEAQVLAAGGNLALAYKQLHPHFIAENLTRDHLMTGFFYLWLLAFLDRGDELLSVVTRLEVLRDSLGQSRQYFDFEMFRVYGLFLTGGTLKETEENILRLYGNVLTRGEKFHSIWAKVFLSLIRPEPHSKLEPMTELNDNHWLRRCLLVKFSKDDSLNNPSFWRFFTTYGGDAVSYLLSRFKLAQSYKDIEFLFPEVKEFAKLQCWEWLQDFQDEEGWIQSGLLRDIVKSDLIFDFYTGKVLNPKNAEVLQPTSHIAILLHSLRLSPVSKEKISLLMGNSSYDPTAHDPQIYTLVSRARHWLSKQNANLDILSSSGTWRFSGRGQLDKFEQKKHKMDQPSDLTGELNYRRDWIYEQVKRNGLITRTEVLSHFPVKKSTAVNDFNFLMDKNLIERIGQGRAVYYRLKGAEDASY